MSSRLWLAAAFVLAFGASPARAETDLIAVTLDQAKIAKLPAGATTLIIGNPMIADVAMLKNNNSMVITGKGFGQTNLIALDAGDRSSRKSRSGSCRRKPCWSCRAGAPGSRTPAIPNACRRCSLATMTRCSRKRAVRSRAATTTLPAPRRRRRRNSLSFQPVARLAAVPRFGDHQPALAEVFEMREGR